ncbi:UNVERIFIED_CONTAM: DUF262 domain-containing protein [Acinetobacter baumannii]|uniref:DUF262 domain-containing protein n=1 Tax=Acinetobacter seifertii TaxID=1530123 RepID=A0A7H2PZR8_9GAMM|nr:MULTISPECIES: DUF262 domain-containing protein [Acinetobacter calcoaceticus/baumannii complex]QNX08351.1 DUF262 domain-containing protein [Acinetobacter seifertii]EJB8517492.1 DUF262 domain-containing protein [Acinetobacter baumannii]ELA7466791.1 DUF262 domain-containing protein [Acinetobacter nosocomialis]EXE17875.1 hypothetical protein J558_2359 [Acinetobacter baumannii 1106579]KRI47914.1 hypothetical protein APD18_01135 [Acinetobacter baumannii]
MAQHQVDQLKTGIWSLKKLLLSLDQLVIPDYQRPYKWTEKNLNALVNDIQEHKDKSAYRLGSIVLHRNPNSDSDENIDIVDGQQRTLTLMLLVWAIIQKPELDLKQEHLNEDLNEISEKIDAFMSKQKFNSDISHHNIYQNFNVAKRIVSVNFSEQDIDFLLNNCQVAVFILDDISEAFQFFDSQNARGRDLEPHDLLKAYHLREFSAQEQHLKAETVAHWENLPSNALAALFSNYLFRIRFWSRGKSARYFNKDHVHLFKGIHLGQSDHHPYLEPLRIAHYFIDDYNAQYQRQIDRQEMSFPFQLDQMIINGRRFFEMVEHYEKQISKVVDHQDQSEKISIFGEILQDRANRIMKTLNKFHGASHRAGDGYVRTLFDCALIFYIDKFATDRLSEAIEKIFIWAYHCRISQYSVQLATIDNYVLEKNIFSLLKYAQSPSELIGWSLPIVDKQEGTKVEPLITLFKELNYLKQEDQNDK